LYVAQLSLATLYENGFRHELLPWMASDGEIMPLNSPGGNTLQ